MFYIMLYVVIDEKKIMLMIREDRIDFIWCFVYNLKIFGVCWIVLMFKLFWVIIIGIVLFIFVVIWLFIVLICVFIFISWKCYLFFFCVNISKINLVLNCLII